MKNLMERGLEIINVLGLIFGAIVISFLGYDKNNNRMLILGTASLTIFVLIFLGYIVLLIRDFIRSGGTIIPTKF